MSDHPLLRTPTVQPTATAKLILFYVHKSTHTTPLGAHEHGQDGPGLLLIASYWL